MIDCSVQAQMDNTGINLSSSIPIQQNCGLESTETKTGDVSDPGGSGINLSTIILLIFAVVVFVAGLIFMIKKRGRNSQQNDQMYNQQNDQMYNQQNDQMYNDQMYIDQNDQMYIDQNDQMYNDQIYIDQNDQGYNQQNMYANRYDTLNNQ